MITLRTPWDSPPLRSNHRLHWARKAKLTRQIRDEAATITRYLMANLDPSAHPRAPVTVTLVWEVKDHRRRDVGASSPTLKAAIDGMVDAGLLRADDHTVVDAEICRIEVGDRRGVRIEVREAT